MTGEEIARLRALEAKAAPGPWESFGCSLDAEGEVKIELRAAGMGGAKATADLASEARNALPRLLDALEAERSVPAGCADHGCEVATVKGGTRTNGGCRCDERTLRRALRAERKRVAALLDRCAALELALAGKASVTPDRSDDPPGCGGPGFPG